MTKIKNIISGFKEGQRAFTESITVIINSVLLAIVYIIGVGFTSIIAKLFRKKFLDTVISKEAKTYWSDIKITKKSHADYYRQF